MEKVFACFSWAKSGPLDYAKMRGMDESVGWRWESGDIFLFLCTDSCHTVRT